MSNTHLFTAYLLCAFAHVIGSSSTAQSAQHNAREVLWYKTPAPVWGNALPVANGRLGAMVFGGANSGANNGDLQASPKNAPLMDGSQTSGADEHLQ